MKRCIPFVVLVASAVSSVSGQDQRPVKHLADAVDLLKHLDLRNTSYEHGAGKIGWTEPRECHTDCSGFVDALLIHSYAYERPAFEKWFGSRRPSAARYYDAIAAQRGFQAIARVSDIQPGDLLAVKYLTRKDNTGHVMLVAEAPRQMRPRKPLVGQSQQWSVTVLDCSQSGHGPADTRHGKGKDGKDHDGLGQGTLRLYADLQGTFVGFTWSTLESSEFKDPNAEPLVIGRLQPNFKP